MRFAYAGMLALVMAGAAAPFGALAAQSAPRLDGNWDITIEMPAMPNMPPGMTMPPMKATKCITPQEAANPQNLVPPSGRGGAGDCKVSDYAVVGNKMTFNMACTGPQGPMNGTGEFLYAGDGYTGGLTMTSLATQMTMTLKLTGKRLGDCVR